MAFPKVSRSNLWSWFHNIRMKLQFVLWPGCSARCLPFTTVILGWPILDPFLNSDRSGRFTYYDIVARGQSSRNTTIIVWWWKCLNCIQSTASKVQSHRVLSSEECKYLMGLLYCHVLLFRKCHGSFFTHTFLTFVWALMVQGTFLMVVLFKTYEVIFRKL